MRDLMQPTPEQLVGMPVLDPNGSRVGTVVDVGLSNWRQPKFLLVKQESGAALLRVELLQVEDVGEDVIRLAAPGKLPALPM